MCTVERQGINETVSTMQQVVHWKSVKYLTEMVAGSSSVWRLQRTRWRLAFGSLTGELLYVVSLLRSGAGMDDERFRDRIWSTFMLTVYLRL